MQLADSVNVVIADRSGGTSAAPYDSRNLGGAVGDDPAAVRENRAKTPAEPGGERVVYLRQVHSAVVRRVTGPVGDDPPCLDGVYTAETGLALAVLVADCAPVFVVDPEARLIGGAHSGRVGTATGVVPALIEAMTADG